MGYWMTCFEWYTVPLEYVSVVQTCTCQVVTVLLGMGCDGDVRLICTYT